MRTIPPQIARLTQLRELNLAQNNLTWLPSEMLSMKIPKLTLSNNPWTPKPSDIPLNTKAVSKAVLHFRIPPLREMCLRALLSPAGPGLKGTALELYELPLAEVDYSTEMQNILRSCVPGSVARPSFEDCDSISTISQPPIKHTRVPRKTAGTDAPITKDKDTDPPDIGVCPSPKHRTQDGQWAHGRKPVFIRWAEERFTWERFGEAEMTLIPVRWRGCGRGCLDFLNVEGDERPAMPEAEDEYSEAFSKPEGGPPPASDLQVVSVASGVGYWTDEEFP